MRLKNTLEYLGLWETLNNPIFKGVEFDPLLKEAGSNAFTMSPSRWVEQTGAIGLITKNGNGGGTYAIKENLIPKELSKTQTSFVYANEADLLNVALFGITAKQWRDENPKAEGNVRDMASLEQLVVLSNLESINAVLIHQGLAQSDRLMQLNKIAISQMKSLVGNKNIKRLK